MKRKKSLKAIDVPANMQRRLFDLFFTNRAETVKAGLLRGLRGGTPALTWKFGKGL